MTEIPEELERLKREAWSKARIVPGFDPEKMRADDYGYLIVFEHYHGGLYGWDIGIGPDSVGIHPISLNRLGLMDPIKD